MNLSISNIKLKKTGKLFLMIITVLVSVGATAQTYDLTAKVIDKKTGVGLSGAYLFIKPGKHYTTSEIDGDVFTMGVPHKEVTITISYVGYADTFYTVDLSRSNFMHRFELRQLSEKIDQVVVTATRTSKEINSVPASIDVIGAKEYQLRANTNLDDLLGSVAGVVVNRSWGIFSKNTSVTMRGLESAARTLILLNGAPMNKLAGGPVNWHLINPDQVDRIEIVKGPASTLYGANAVGGAINIITKQPNKKFEGVARAFYASYDTYGASLNVGQNFEKDNRGLSYTTYSFYRSGEGYYFDEGINFDDTDEKTYLEEYNIGGTLSYRYSKKSKLTIDYKFHDDFRGDGRKVYEEDGSYYSYTVNFGQVRYETELAGFDVNVLGYVQDEGYYRQNESVNSSNEYRLYETNSVKRDVGAIVNLGRRLSQNHELVFGVDTKSGLLTSVDDYMTSTDSINYEGQMDFVGAYIQDEMKYLGGKLHLTAGIRVDRARFYNGSLQVDNPSKTTGFDGSFRDEFEENDWVAISPKVAARYKFSNKFSTYASVASGFNPPKIDDLCKSGKITKGFKLANPELEPETLWNYEVGFDYKPSKKLSVSTSLYYSRGIDIHNLVGTGDTVDTGGATLKPVLRKLNISEVEITGAELSFAWKFVKDFEFITNYSYSRSLVQNFVTNDGEDLSGNYIIEVPPHTLFVGLFYRGKLFDASLDYNYTDAIWVDIQNTSEVDPYDIWNFKISRGFGKHWGVSLTVQNLLDNQYIDRKERKSPGRFTVFELSYRW